MYGFGHEEFGNFPYGGSDWAKRVLWDELPEAVKQEDLDAGGWYYRFVTTMLPSMNDLRRLIYKSFDYVVDPRTAREDLLVYMARNFGIIPDMEEPEEHQRTKIEIAGRWRLIKGTNTAYEVLSAIHGFSCTVQELWSDGDELLTSPGTVVDGEVGTTVGNAVSGKAQCAPIVPGSAIVKAVGTIEYTFRGLYSDDTNLDGIAGMTFGAGKYWILDTSLERIFRYDTNFSYDGFSFSIAAEMGTNAIPRFLEYDGTNLLVMDVSAISTAPESKLKVHSYLTNGTYNGSIIDYSGLSLTTTARGIAYDGTNFLIGGVVGTEYRVYKYLAVSPYTYGGYVALPEVSTGAAHSLTYDGVHLWVRSSGNLYKYLPSGGSFVFVKLLTDVFSGGTGFGLSYTNGSDELIGRSDPSVYSWERVGYGFDHERTLTDNGDETLSGDGTGTVDYSYGLITAEFGDSDPEYLDGAVVTVDYGSVEGGCAEDCGSCKTHKLRLDINPDTIAGSDDFTIVDAFNRLIEKIERDIKPIHVVISPEIVTESFVLSIGYRFDVIPADEEVLDTSGFHPLFDDTSW
jgi:hypothetical protein